MADRFDLRSHLLGIADQEERARAIHEGGWAGLPDIDDIEASVASPHGGEFQRLLAAQRRPRTPVPKRALQRFERVRAARSDRYGPKNPDSPTADPDTSSEPEREEHSGFGSDNVPKAPVRVPDIGGWLPVGLFKERPTPQEAQAGIAEARRRFSPNARPFRSSNLSGWDAVRVYEAIAFAMWRYGEVMNVHITVLWETYQVGDHERAAKLLSDFFNEAKKWARVGTTGTSRERRRERTGEGFAFRYVYVHECGPQRGFHTHILCRIPPNAIKGFTEWSSQAFVRLTGNPGDRRSLRVVPSRAKGEGPAVQRCWGWFRYMVKQLDAKYPWGHKNERGTSLRDIFKPRYQRDSLPVTCAKLVGGSHDIWTKAQTDANFSSCLREGDLNLIYTGMELSDWRLRALSEDVQRRLGDF